ncbi:MAG TPA: hypothetical protein VK738_14975 [Terriglobales bacterium]|nr:hypothetical protein [Terriglobales bacterium]
MKKRNAITRIWLRSFATVSVLTVCILLVGGSLVHACAQSAPARADNLKRFLQKYDGNPSSPSERTTRYAVAFADLRDNGTEEAIVYLIGPNWCGSGGCAALILAPSGSSFKVITKTSVTQLPILVLPEKTNGWHDLGVGVAGGASPGYEARLRYNGKKYPGNPTVLPAQRLSKKAGGKVVIVPPTLLVNSVHFSSLEIPVW